MRGRARGIGINEGEGGLSEEARGRGMNGGDGRDRHERGRSQRPQNNPHHRLNFFSPDMPWLSRERMKETGSFCNADVKKKRNCWQVKAPS